MFMTLLLLLLLQSAPAEDSLRETVEAFAGGSEEARKVLLKHETRAIRALRKGREKAPAKIDALIYEIKKAAGGEEHAAVVKELEAKGTVDVEDWVLGDVLNEGLGRPLLVDPALYTRSVGLKVTLAMKDRPRHEILSVLCRRAEADWGLFYGVVLVAAPDRLWPAGPLPAPVALTEEQVRDASGWIAALASEKLEDREAAAGDLSKLGVPLIPLLEKAAERGDAEVAARCRDLVALLRKPPQDAVFHLPSAARQKLSDADARFVQDLRENQISFKVSDIVMHGALRLMLGPRQIRGEYGEALREKRITLDAQNAPGWAVLSVLCHAHGFDFLVRDGVLIFDTREIIERRLPATRK